MKKIIICLITVLMLFATIGCSNQYDGLTKIENELFEVYIPDTYDEQKIDGYDYVGYDENTSFMVFHEVISDLQQYIDISEETTLQEYAELIRQANQMDEEFEMDKNGNLAVQYESNVDGVDFFYYTAVKKGNGNFYIATCSCLKEDAQKHTENFSRWLSTFKTY